MTVFKHFSTCCFLQFKTPNINPTGLFGFKGLPKGVPTVSDISYSHLYLYSIHWLVISFFHRAFLFPVSQPRLRFQEMAFRNFSWKFHGQTKNTWHVSYTFCRKMLPNILEFEKLPNMGVPPKIPKKLTYPTLGKGKSSTQKYLWDGIC